MPIQELNPFDEFFLYDNDSPANAALLFRMDKFPYEKYRNFIRNVQHERLPKQKVKLMQMFGRFYWIKMSDKEFDEKFDKYVPDVQEVRTMAEMEKHCNMMVNSDFDIYNNVPWRYCIYNNVSDEYTYVLLTAHHSYTDAI